MMKSELRSRLGKVPILRKRSEFVRVQTQGKRFRGRHILLLVMSGEEEGRLGLTVSRKVGNAVVRNRVRRRLREIARTHPEKLSAGRDHVVVAFPSAAKVDFATLREEMTCLLDGAKAWACSNDS